MVYWDLVWQIQIPLDDPGSSWSRTIRDPETSQVRIVLDDLGCTVTAVGDGADALRQMETFRPQLILLDLVMPQAQMDGFDVLMRIEEFRVPVIVVSALGDALRATISPRVAAVLSKPVDVYDLIREVNRLLASTSSAF